MATRPESNLELKIGHVLFMDIVGYSKLWSSKQRELFQVLNDVVRNTTQFRAAERAHKLVRFPTGDGMVLAFFTSVDAPVRCAQEIAAALHDGPELPLRMGINSGPVDQVSDVNDRHNVTGIGINLAQRVMACGDAGHILLSKRVADDLAQYDEWKPSLHELGEAEVKHGVRIDLVNFCHGAVGNPEVPQKLREARRFAAKRRKKRLLQVALSLATAAIIALWSYLHWVSRVALQSPAGKSIAVLPLQNLSEEKENAYFADGIQDELLADLSKIKNLKVISRTSVMPYKTDITRNLKEIARQLGVSTIVEGSVRRSGNHVRVTIQLMDALNDRHLWAQNYDRNLSDALALQGELATQIAAEVGAILSPQEKARIEATPTSNTAAYEAYLRGRALLVAIQNRSQRNRSIQAFEDAVNLDPDFALAWANLSIAQSYAYWNDVDPAVPQLKRAKEALDRATTLASDLPETHLAHGYYLYYGERDYPAALAEFVRAEQSLPNNADVVTAIGLINRRMGHWEEAFTNLQRAVELDPRTINRSKVFATTCASLRRFPEVNATADRVLSIEPGNSIALEQKLVSYWAIGNLDAAEALLAKPALDPADRGVHALFRGRYGEAVDIFEKALGTVEHDGFVWLSLRLGLAQQRTGDAAAARATYERVRGYLKHELEGPTAETVSEAGNHSSAGVVAAALGEPAAAIAEGKRGLALQPTAEDAFEGPGREEELAQIYSLLGDADHAIPILQRLLKTHYLGSYGAAITPALLRNDPIWDPIRNDLRFQQLEDTTAM